MTEQLPLLSTQNSRDSVKATAALQLALREVRSAIAQGIHPTLITQGSSGSYFCYNVDRQVIAVFKPKNEEPYGAFNPKWGKWLQRTLCRCCFGRSCLLSNVGYLSEAAASVVSRRFQFNIVPETAVARLASPNFNYSYLRRKLDHKMHQYFELPAKVGSFQLFIPDAQAATVLLQPGRLLSPRGERSFRRQFERLVVLDYVIRNTDRGMDNWLVRFPKSRADSRSSTPSSFQAGSEDSSSPESVDFVEIFGIDNGLAFPVKHPDEWRSYPYAWADLPHAYTPFSEDLIADVLPKIQSPEFVQGLIQDLRKVMSIDTKYSPVQFQKQMGVLQGQLYNLEQVLLKGGCPADLVAMPAMVVETGPRRSLLRRIITDQPWFRCC